MLRSCAFIIFALALVSGCATVRVPEAKQEAEIAALAEQLRDLSPSVNTNEAARAAEAAVRYPLQLAQTYHATPPAVINAGVTKDGLAMRMSDDQWREVLSTDLDGAFYCARASMFWAMM